MNLRCLTKFLMRLGAKKHQKVIERENGRKSEIEGVCINVQKGVTSTGEDSQERNRGIPRAHKEEIFS